MRPNTARLAGEFTAALLHMGPGPHPDGSPQAVHGGGSAHQAPPAPRAQMAFDFASPAPTKAPARPKPAGPDTTAITNRLLAKYPETEPEDDKQFSTGRHVGWLAPDGRLIDFSDSPKMHAEVAHEVLHGRPAKSDLELSNAQREFQKLGFTRVYHSPRGGLNLGATGAIAPAARARIEHVFDMAKPREWRFDLDSPDAQEESWHLLSSEDNATEKLRAQTGIDIRGLYETALARRRKQLCLS